MRNIINIDVVNKDYSLCSIDCDTNCIKISFELDKIATSNMKLRIGSTNYDSSEIDDKTIKFLVPETIYLIEGTYSIKLIDSSDGSEISDTISLVVPSGLTSSCKLYLINNGNVFTVKRVDEKIKSSIMNEYSESETDSYSCDYINKMKKNAITVRFTDTQNTPESYATVNFNSIGAQVGDKLTLQGKTIVIGDDVSYVKVSGSLWVEVSIGYSWVSIMLNEGAVASGIFPSILSGQDVWRVHSIPPAVIKVKKGDRIRMDVSYSVANQNNRIAGFYIGSCYLTVEEL